MAQRLRTTRLVFATLAGMALVFAPAPTHAYQTVREIRQPESRDADGHITVEAAVIHVVACTAAGENGGQFYVYEYVNRPENSPRFRAIRPPDWTRALGNRDFVSFVAAATVACAPRATEGVPATATRGGGPSRGIAGTWQLTSTCPWYGDTASHGTWKATIVLASAPDGSLSGYVQNDPLNPAIVPDATTSPQNPGPLRSAYSGNTMTLVLRPAQWESVLQLTGQLSGSRIDGNVHHYGSDDCRFSMQ